MEVCAHSVLNQQDSFWYPFNSVCRGGMSNEEEGAPWQDTLPRSTFLLFLPRGYDNASLKWNPVFMQRCHSLFLILPNLVWFYILSMGSRAHFMLLDDRYLKSMIKNRTLRAWINHVLENSLSHPNPYIL